MTSGLLQSLGGIGLFLVGMTLLTEGLRGLAGQSLRAALARFTRTPFSGAVAGALTTAVIQSSSATTVTAVGFVGAGLMTFPQALGVIFGANVGTTITGWLVAILGFRLQLGQVAMPLVLLGALCRLFGDGRLTGLGTALAGFGLLFFGIDAMQAGMAGLEGLVAPEDFPDDSLSGRLELVLAGVLITLVTQSSSAGVATALVALGSGTISFPQAAAMVIGMDIGTTFTAALATIGGSTATRRTGLSHVIYNLLTGAMAFLLLGSYAALMAPVTEAGDCQIALVVFHSGFNLLGVMLVLPFTGPFARLVTMLVRERGPHLTRHLGSAIPRDPDAATDAVAATVEELARAEFAALARLLGHAEPRRAEPRRADRTDLRAISEALAATRSFIDQITPGAPDSPRAHRIAAALHMLDHLGRLYFRCRQTQRLAALGSDHRLRRLRALLRGLAGEAAVTADAARSEARLNRLRRILRAQRRVYRERTILMASSGRLTDAAALPRLDAVRWLHRVGYHLWRIQHHMNRMRGAAAPASPRREAAVEVLED